MARKHKTKARSKPPSFSPAGGGTGRRRWRRTRRAAAWIVLAVVMSTAGVFGMKALESHVLLGLGGADVADYRIALAPRPSWMPVSLAAQITRSLRPEDVGFHDPAFTKAVYDRARLSPWIRGNVKVVRNRAGDSQTGIVEIEAQFRQPIASVSSPGQVRREYVDADGVRLPPHQVPMWAAVIPPARGDDVAGQAYYCDRADIPPGLQIAPIHYIRIDGVQKLPPPVGHRWEGDDLAAGLRLVKLVRTRPYANQITVVDVYNHAKRVLPDEPELRMYAQVGRGRRTDIRFGRFSLPGGGDFNVSAERKMSYLDQYVRENNGQLAGINTFIDLQYDALNYSLN